MSFCNRCPIALSASMFDKSLQDLVECVIPPHVGSLALSPHDSPSTCCAVKVLSKVLKAARVLLPQGLCVDLLACVPVVYPFTSSSLCPKTFHHFAPCLLV